MQGVSHTIIHFLTLLQAEIERLEAFVARFGAKASKASQAQSRMKQLEKLRESAPEMPAASAGAGPGDARKVRSLHGPLCMRAIPAKTHAFCTAPTTV